MIFSLILVLTGPRIFSTAWFRVRPCTASSSRLVMMSLAMMPAREAGVSSIGETTLIEAVFHRDLDAEAAELAAGLHLHVAEALGIHVARMRIEAGQHAGDRGLDQLAVVGLLDIVAAHALEHVAEQIELAIGVRGCGPGARAHQHRARLRDEQRQRCAGGRAEENNRSLAHHPRTFSPSFAAHHGPGSIRSAVFAELDIEHQVGSRWSREWRRPAMSTPSSRPAPP